MDNDKINVKIQSRQEILFNGKASSISSINDKGEFSILPYHANFISLVNTQIKVKDLEGNEKKFQVNNGVLRVEANLVEIYVGVKVN